MAQNPKLLRVVAASALAPSTRCLDLECIEGEPFSAVGGKYIIVHTGLVIGERAVKRAYSLMPVPERPGVARIAVKLWHGAGSRALHDVALGATLGFSGPWGKLIGEGGLAARTLLVATDTGITSALGVVEGFARDAPAPSLDVLWLHAPEERFLGINEVRARVQAARASFAAATIPAVDSPARVDAAFALIEGRARELLPTHVIATGDGAIVHPLRERLPRTIASVQDVRCECFFRNPERKSA